MVACALAFALVNNRLDAAEPATGSSRAALLEQFTLINHYGKEVPLSDFRDKPILVVAFLGTECPLAKLYSGRLKELQETYADRHVQFIGVNSNTQDSLTEIGHFVQRYEVDFPMLKDRGNQLADALAAARTPEVFVFDADRVQRYHGRIDDQYGVGSARGEPTTQDLKTALDQILAGEPVTDPETTAVGCIIGRVKNVAPSGNITFTKDIAPILNSRCVQCHREGEIGPFALTSYADILGWEDMILEVIEDNRMPPWNANPEYGHFKNDARLSPAERETIANWVAGGMPEGDQSDLPSPPQFADGWRIPAVDEVIYMRDTAFEVPAEGTVDYQYYKVDPKWTEDKYITAAQARPDDVSVVHHILVFVIPPGSDDVDLGQVIAGYAPGSVPNDFEDGLAAFVPAGSQLMFELHYTPNGTATTDRSYVGFRFTDKESVRKIVSGKVAIQPKLRIPPGEPNYTVQAAYQAKRDELLLSMTPHMHLRGKAFRYEAHYPDGSTEILLDVPRYDFNWQLKYILSEPKPLPKGTKVVCTAVFDNSPGNPFNPDPTKLVKWGRQSFDEMMIGFMDVIPQ